MHPTARTIPSYPFLVLMRSWLNHRRFLYKETGIIQSLTIALTSYHVPSRLMMKHETLKNILPISDIGCYHQVRFHHTICEQLLQCGVSCQEPCSHNVAFIRVELYCDHWAMEEHPTPALNPTDRAIRADFRHDGSCTAGISEEHS